METAHPAVALRSGPGVMLPAHFTSETPYVCFCLCFLEDFPLGLLGALFTLSLQL